MGVAHNGVETIDVKGQVQQFNFPSFIIKKIRMPTSISSEAL